MHSGRSASRGPVEAELADLLDAMHADPAHSVARYARAAELFAALLRRRGDARPWALVLEDVHEADAASLEVLLQLAHEGAVPRALVVLTMRPVPYRPELAEVVAAWTRAGARYLELRPLTARATVELAENLVGGPVGPVAARHAGDDRRQPAARRRRGADRPLRRGAGQRPTASLDSHRRAVADAARRGGPPARRVPRARRAHAARAGLRAGHVVRHRGPGRRWPGDPVADCWRTLRHGLAAGVVRARGDRLVFGHDLVRGALYNGLEPDERRALHARAAWALRQAGAPSQIVTGHLERAR